MTDLLSHVETGVALVAAAASLDELSAAEQEVLGRRSAVTAARQRLGALAAEDRKEAGRAVNEARERLQAAVEARRAELEATERQLRLAADRMDLTEVTAPSPLGAPGAPWARGHHHLVSRTQQQLEDVFVAMGYRVAEGPEAESDWYNFEALNMPPGHPARSMWDTLYLKLGAPRSVLLRTHTSPVQIRTMQSQAPPLYVIAPGRCYRRDTPDARHLSVFHQIEGLVIDRNISFGDLAGTIEAFTGAYFGPTIHSRLRPSFFPFTEPSAEFDVTCIFCDGAGCRVCSHAGWIELGGCGMVDPNVLEAVGIDNEEWQGFAFGFGIDRCAMLRHNIDDIRHFVTNDIRFLRQF